MAINFPDNPSPNAVFTDNGVSWKWDGTTWEGIPAPENVKQPSPHGE